jgi:hypothetical protein
MDKKSLVASAIALVFVGVGVYSNVMQQLANDRSKLPEKVEQSRGFQRWITNLKNKDLNLDADEFRMIEENEIYNTKWLKVYSADDPTKKAEFEKYIEAHKNTEKVIYSPSERELLDYRDIERDGYHPNEVHFYGLKDDKILDARILDCSIRANCYFDRAYFLTNDLFVITEVSRNINKKDETTPPCMPTESCTYTFKLHLVDLVKNSRLIYESKPFDAVLNKLIPDL